MKIKDKEYEYGLFLAPLAGVADRAFRIMCISHGAQGVTTEMISSKALVFGDKKTEKIARIGNDEQPCALQLFGSCPETMAKAARLALKFSPSMIDINMGCPVHKVVSSGDGSAIMKNPALAYEIVSRVVDAVGDVLPVTVKMRTGYDKTCINAPEIASLCGKAGASAVYVHGRTREQMYSPPCDCDTIRSVKQSVGIPVIGNGDIFSVSDAANMLEKTGCDGIMIGRGALGNPYFFEQLKAYLRDGTILPPQSPEEKLADIMRHMELLIEDKGDAVAASECRKHLSWYIKGMRGAAGLRDEINRTEDIGKTLSLVRKIFENE